MAIEKQYHSMPNVPTNSGETPSSSSRLLIARERTESTFEEIPIIDLLNARSDDPAVRREIADQIRDASVNVGFFYIKGHGIPEEKILRAVEAGKRFFALPIEEKVQLDIHKSANFKGYTALLGENTDPENRGDLHEGFDIGWDPEDRNLNNTAGATAMSGLNVWPDEDKLGLSGFKQDVLDYYYACVHLGQSLFPLFALALDLPENFFEDKTQVPAAIMRILHYPPQTGTVDDRVIGIGAHTDYECFTILWQDKEKALQVMNTAGKWIDAIPIPGTLVLNLGDQFARWTNDVFKSTVHRAINRSGVERYSMPLFFGSDYDVKLEALPSCISDDYLAKYEVITAGDYVRSRLEATYAK